MARKGWPSFSVIHKVWSSSIMSQYWVNRMPKCRKTVIFAEEKILFALPTQ